MKFLFPLGRVLFSLVFITAAPRHFTHEGIQHAAALGVPAAGVLVPMSGVMTLLGGLSVAIGYRARWGAWVLIGFLIPVTWWMHGYWRLAMLLLCTFSRPCLQRMYRCWEERC